MIMIFATTTKSACEACGCGWGFARRSGSAFCSLSFTAFMGLFNGHRVVRDVLVLPFLDAACCRSSTSRCVLGGLAATSYMNHMKLAEETPEDASLSSSLWMRATIVQNCWPFCADAGALGWGKKIKKDQLDLD